MSAGAYDRLFQAIQVGPHLLRSSVFASAHQPGLADNGRPGDRYIAYHRERARSGFAMQITGATPVAPSSVWDPRFMLLNTDESVVDGYQRLAAAVHDAGGRMLAQLMHPGAAEIDRPDVVSASSHISELSRQAARAITVAEMDTVVEQYGAGADRCRRGHLDGIEIPIAWGYLLGSFVSPRMNQRTDEFGGGVENRLRFPLRVLNEVRRVVGRDMIVGVRLVGDELVDDGVHVTTSTELARLLAASGVIDYINVIAGSNMVRMARVDHWPAAPTGVGIFRHLARAVRDVVDIPVLCVGRINHPDVALDILQAGDADMVGVARAHIVDPEFLSKTRAGRIAEIRPCSAVNVCINSLLEEAPIHCMANPEVGREGTIDESDIGAGRTAVVIGAGPAGIEASRRLQARGFAVQLFERGNGIGGQMRIWTAAPARSDTRKLLEWWAADLRRREIAVHLDTEVSAERVAELSPALVVVATGARPIAHPRLAATHPQVFDVVSLAAVPPGHVLVADEMGRADAMLIAELLASRGRRVTLATSCLHPGEGEGISSIYPLIRLLGHLGIDIHERVRVTGLDQGTVSLTNQWDGRERAIEGVDSVVHWSGSASDTTLAAELVAAGVQTRIIGDALLPRRVDAAVHEGAELAWALSTSASANH